MDKTTAALRLEENIPSLRRYAWSLLRNSSNADDLVQDCLVRAWDRISTIRTEGDLRPWLFTIMHNVFATRWRRTKRRADLMPEDGEVEAAVAPAQEAKAEIRDVLRGLATLPEEQRQVILLVAVEGFRYEEVADSSEFPSERSCRA